MKYDKASGLLSGVRAGMGLSVLPAFIADRESDLIRCIPPKNEDTNGVWLLTHERLRPVPRVRAVLDFLEHELPRRAWAQGWHGSEKGAVGGEVYACSFCYVYESWDQRR